MNELRFAKVADITENVVTLIFSDEEAATTKGYRYLDSYTPVVGDRVACIKFGSSYLVLGKIH